MSATPEYPKLSIAQKQTLERAAGAIADIIEDTIMPLVADPAMYVTVLVRHPSRPERYILVTRDNLDGVIATIQRAKMPAHTSEV